MSGVSGTSPTFVGRFLSDVCQAFFSLTFVRRSAEWQVCFLTFSFLTLSIELAVLASARRHVLLCEHLAGEESGLNFFVCWSIWLSL